MGRKGRKRQDVKDIFIVILLFVSIGAIALNMWHLKEIEKKDAAEALEIQEKVAKNPDSISIPGYEGVTLKANSLKQEISFSNPQQNCCYFVITLCLEDGTVLWESDYVEPGKNSEPVKLNQKLESGTYKNAVLKYSCYSIEDKSQLNGAETKLTIWVK